MRVIAYLLLAPLLVLAPSAPSHAQPATHQIRLNQIGFYPNAPKVAAVVDAPGGAFYVTTPDRADTVFTGTLGEEKTWSYSGESVRLADFSAVRTPGSYVVVVPDVGQSHPFEVAAAVHQEVTQAALKAYYYMRASTALTAPYAGRWARPAGHPDTEVRVHPSAATATRPAGTILTAPRGWYDAGDYNKYIVNSGISMGTLFLLYKQYPDYFDAFDTTIPESGDDVPDLLDEALWNLRWMLQMQDEDGGVYHKLTTPNFEGAVMPHRANQPRYVVQKGTAATLDFAAVMAQAARIYDTFKDELPGLADSCLTAARSAWNWARAHPSVAYNQNQLNASFDPDINTGAYGDGTFTDEFRWAAAELYITTKADSFITMYAPANVSVPSWPNVAGLAFFSLAHHRHDLTDAVDTSAVTGSILTLADELVASKEASAYDVVMGHAPWDFVWGSNSTAANQGLVLMQAYRLTGEDRYLEAALANLDYLLGRNGTGYSYLTGYGDHTPMHPHHRPSEADGIADPVPGLLVGGPHDGGQDVGTQSWQCEDYTDLPANSYIDDWCSYATNEITINWNAPMLYLADAIEATLSATGRPVATEPIGEARPRPFRLGSFPNPTTNRLVVQLVLNEPAPVTLSVFDLLGREIAYLLNDRLLAAGEHEEDFDTRRLPAGMYLLRLHTPRQALTHTFIVAR